MARPKLKETDPLRWDRHTLKELRKVLGLTADEFGARIGRTGWTVVGWERGSTVPNAIDLANISNATSKAVQAFFRIAS